LAKKRKDNLLVLCVDRDNDLGVKTGVEGPVIGRKANLEAANKLILADPTESDANCMFAAVKKFDELKKEYPNTQLATITGHGKAGFQSDRRLNEQLDVIESKIKPEAFVLVTDGGEDDQVLPLLQSRSKIFSKQLVIIKQAKQVESVYYTIKEALKDPYIAMIIFGIPGIIMVFYALTLYYNLQNLFVQGVAFIIGVYLFIKGVGIELKLHGLYHKVISSVSLQRPSFSLFLGSAFIFFFALVSLVTNLPLGRNPIGNVLSAIQGIYFFLTLSVLFVILGRAIDAVHFRMAIKLRKYFLYGISSVIVWFLLDAGTLVLMGEAVVDFFWLAIGLSLAAIFISFKVLDLLDARNKVTELLIGLPVFNKRGIWLGTIQKIDKRSNAITYFKGEEEKNARITKKGLFQLKKNKVVLSA